MTRWFRLYDEMLDDHKVQSLSPELFKSWVNLLAVASRNGGILPPVEKLAFALRVSNHEMQSRLEDLVLCGLFDLRADGQYEPHNWPKRQWKSDDSADRVRKHRASKRCNDDVTVTVTPPESDTDTDTDPNGLSFPSAARKRAKEDPKGFNNVFGMKDDRKERLHARAEGLGLNVEELLAICNAKKNLKSRSGYFTSLCIDRLQKQLKGLDEQVIRAALWDAGTDAYVALQKMLVGAA